MTTTIIVAIVAVVVALLIAVPVTCKVAVNNKIQKDAEVVGTAEDKARSIIDEALKTAQNAIGFVLANYSYQSAGEHISDFIMHLQSNTKTINNWRR